VTAAYDSLTAKVIARGADREQALARAVRAVDAFTIVGPKSNLPFLAGLLSKPEFVSGDHDTGIIGRTRV
jgi:acetyl-CoA carboxylase biotin carboxylase subunit